MIQVSTISMEFQRLVPSPPSTSPTTTLPELFQKNFRGWSISSTSTFRTTSSAANCPRGSRISWPLPAFRPPTMPSRDKCPTLLPCTTCPMWICRITSSEETFRQLFSRDPDLYERLWSMSRTTKLAESFPAHWRGCKTSRSRSRATRLQKSTSACASTRDGMTLVSDPLVAMVYCVPSEPGTRWVARLPRTFLAKSAEVPSLWVRQRVDPIQQQSLPVFRRAPQWHSWWVS
mmetsp:Transcript_8633/g.17941  ORF Transcript_8633/g.17941 Transcript_8633/m.17941 type:complete len:232 (-) Transcript_8633:297-992(-)